jgi:hypothetical protein
VIIDFFIPLNRYDPDRISHRKSNNIVTFLSLGSILQDDRAVVAPYADRPNVVVSDCDGAAEA